MTIRKIDKIKEIVSHPLEDFFNIEPTSTEVIKYERKTELIGYQDFDAKDTELEEAYQEIFDAAMTGYDNLNEMIDTADTKHAARLAEVSVQHLNVALAAATKKTNLKENKDKLIARARTGAAGKGSNNTIVLVDNRNDVLRRIQEMQNKQSDNIIDVEVISTEDKK